MHQLSESQSLVGYTMRSMQQRQEADVSQSAASRSLKAIAYQGVFVPFCRARNDLVVDVGEVPAVGDVVAEAHEGPVEDVEGHVDARMADVAVVVHGNSADVH